MIEAPEFFRRFFTSARSRRDAAAFSSAAWRCSGVSGGRATGVLLVGVGAARSAAAPTGVVLLNVVRSGSRRQSAGSGGVRGVRRWSHVTRAPARSCTRRAPAAPARPSPRRCAPRPAPGRRRRWHCAGHRPGRPAAPRGRTTRGRRRRRAARRPARAAARRTCCHSSARSPGASAREVLQHRQRAQQRVRAALVESARRARPGARRPPRSRPRSRPARTRRGPPAAQRERAGDPEGPRRRPTRTLRAHQRRTASSSLARRTASRIAAASGPRRSTSREELGST